jgi:nucleoside-diphosphate-sugar epimerase
MKLLITGAQLGSAWIAERLASRHEVAVDGGMDLRSEEALRPLLAGVDAVLHVEPFALSLPGTTLSDDEVLDRAARGTFTLLRGMVSAGVERLVLASRLEVLEGHGPGLVLAESWKPLPDTSAAALAPFVAELTAREFVRVHPLQAACLRFGDPDAAEPLSTRDDVIGAVESAIAMEVDLSGHHWRIFQISRSPRYSGAVAAAAPLKFVPGDS